jgi:heavy metal sensor kinase
VFDFVRTIRFKLTVWFVGILALVIFAISALLYFGLQRALIQSVDNNLHSAGIRSVAPARNVPDLQVYSDQEPSYPGLERYDQLRQLMLLSNTPARLLALDGSLLQSDALFPTGIDISAEQLLAANSGSARYETIVVRQDTFRLYTAPVRINDTRVAIVQVVDTLNEQLATLASLRALLLWLIPISLLFAGIGGSLLAGGALAPMKRVRREVEKIIEKGDLSHRVSVGLPDDEVGRLARTFDQLLVRVDQAMERERQFTSDASHELRTPLTVLKGEISVALSRMRSAGEYRQTLSQLESTVDDMHQLVEDLLTLTRVANNRQALVKAPIDVCDLVSQVCERMQVIADRQGVVLHSPTEPAGMVVMGDRIKLQRVFTNLVDNAVRYTPKGGRVDVAMRRENNTVLIDVRDTGRGIAPEHFPKLFQRFYRADSGRSRDVGGTGLGLALAQTIVKAHGGKITVSSKPGQGSCFTVLLPAASNQTVIAAPPVKKEKTRLPMTIARPKMLTPVAAAIQPAKPIALHNRSFRAMNTDIALFLLSDDSRHANCVLDAAEWFFMQVEWRLSRFRESSELSLLNRSGSARASRTLFDIMQLALQAHADTCGVFNPLIGRALAAAGYDRTFDDIGTDQVLARHAPIPAAIPSLADAVTLDVAMHQITLLNGAQIDLGGIAKGWAIDRAFHTISKLGPCCVNAGGDIRVCGSFEPGGNGWRVDIEDPFAAETLNAVGPSQVRVQTQSVHAVMLRDKSIATSGIVKRRWVVDGAEQHHLIDPRSGEPARNGLLSVTAIGDTTVQAEVAAKTVFILGEEEGSAWADERHIPSLIMFRDGEYLCNQWFPSVM